MAINEQFGSLLAGTWINTMLYVWELTQIHRYYNTYSSDRLLIKITVSLTLLFDTIATLGGFAFVYLDMVVYWGNQQYLMNHPWSPVESVYVAATGVSSTVTQAFLLHRFWNLTGYRAISLAILVLVLASMAGAFASATILALYPAYTLREHIKWSIRCVCTWLVSGAATDVITAVALLVQFTRIDARFKSTKQLMKRLVTLTVKTGTFTAIWAMSILCAYLFFPGYAYNTLGFCMGRVYTLTLLFNLNIRRSLRRHDTMIDVESIHLDDVETSVNGNAGSENGNSGASETIAVAGNLDDLDSQFTEKVLDLHKQVNTYLMSPLGSVTASYYSVGRKSIVLYFLAPYHTHHYYTYANQSSDDNASSYEQATDYGDL